MRKTTFQRVITNRIQEAAPKLKYVAFYHREEERLNACMPACETMQIVPLYMCCLQFTRKRNIFCMWEKQKRSMLGV